MDAVLELSDLDILKSVEDTNAQKLNTVINGPLFNTIEYDIESLLIRVKNIDNLTDEEINKIIISQHNLILNYDIFFGVNYNRNIALNLFTNKRFLRCLSSVIGSCKLTKHERVCLSKITYDYYIYYSNKPEFDSEILDMLLSCTSWANEKEILILSSIYGIGGAKVLSMIRNSSFKVDKNIHRVNEFLLRWNGELSVQNIIDTYCILFERFTDVFVYTMLESKESINLNEEQNRKFNNISIALITILDSLNTVDMSKVIYDYHFTFNSIKASCSTNRITYARFKLSTIKDKPRVLDVLRSVLGVDWNTI